MDCSNNKLLSHALYVLLRQSITKPYLLEIKLTPVEMGWIEKFMIQCPESIVDITKGIQNIISDGVINIHDIPAIVKLVGDIINNHAIRQEMTNLNNSKVFIKLIMHIVIYSDLFIIPSVEKNIMEIMINNSIDLLFFNLRVVEVETETCFNYIEKYFTLY